MPRYSVRKDIRFEYEVDAATPEAALAVPWPKDDPDAVSIIRERARDLDRPKSAGVKVITDRQLTPGRRFTGKYLKQEFRLEVRADGQIEVQKKGSSTTETYASMNRAAMAATGKKAINVWAWVRDTEAAKPEEPPEAVPTEPAPELAPPKPAKAKKGSKATS